MASTPTEIMDEPSGTLSKSKKRFNPKVLRFVSIILVFLVWFAITRDGFGLLRPIIFPSPLMVLDAAVNVSSLLWGHIWATSLRVLVGVSAGVFAGLVVGLAMAYSQHLYHFLDPLVESFRPVPVIAMIPFFILWFGIDEIGKFLLVFLGVVMIMVVNTYEVVRNVPHIYIQAAQSLGASKFEIYRTIIVPAIVPSLIGPVRTSSALAFTLVAAAEFMGAQAGLGYMILNARRTLNTDTIYLGVLFFGILSALLDLIIRRTAGHITRWSERSVS